MQPQWESLAVFFQSDQVGGFAVKASLKIDGVMREIEGIFDDPHFSAELGEYDLDSSEPRFTCRAVDVKGAKDKDLFLLGDKAYTLLKAPKEDGTGLAVLRLSARAEKADKK